MESVQELEKENDSLQKTVSTLTNKQEELKVFKVHLILLRLRRLRFPPFFYTLYTRFKNKMVLLYKYT